MLKSAASAKRVVVLNMRPWMLGLISVGVGAVMLMTGCMTVLRSKQLGQLIQRKLWVVRTKQQDVYKTTELGWV